MLPIVNNSETMAHSKYFFAFTSKRESAMAAPRPRKLSLTQRIANFSQWARQKTGRSQSTPLDGSLVQGIAKFHAMKKELLAVQRDARRLLQCKERLLRANQGFHVGLATSGSHAKADTDNCHAVTQSYVTAGRKLDAAEANCLAAYRSLVVDRLDRILSKEVKECETVISQHSAAHLALDALKHKLRNIGDRRSVTFPPAKLQALEGELEARGKTFRALTEQVVNLLSIAEQSKNLFLSEGIVGYMQAQQIYYETASDVVLGVDKHRAQLVTIRRESKDKKNVDRSRHDQQEDGKGASVGANLAEKQAVALRPEGSVD